MKRGDIYFIKPHEAIGHETAKARPGVIVSNNVLNATSPVVEVVYLTTRPKKDMPTHAAIEATGTPSTALCEHIDHVDKSLLDNWLGVCSEEEMAGVDKALLCSLGIEVPEKPGLQMATPTEMLDFYRVEKHRAEAARDAYKEIVERLLLGVKE